MFDDVKDFLRLLDIPELVFLGDDQVNVDVGVDNCLVEECS